jgi:hypothetical protein
MGRAILLLLCVVLVGACGSIGARKRERAEAYASLPASERQLIENGEIERGMGTNAVYIAWGKPSRVTEQPGSSGAGTNLIWVYYGTRPVTVPGWVYLPDEYGNWTLQYQPTHYSTSYPKAEVIFRNGQVVDWKRF